MPIIMKSVAEEALEEARMLLVGLTIPGAGRGARLEGSLVSITIGDQPGTEPGTREITVRCFVPGRLSVPWENCAFLIANTMTFLDRDGRARLQLNMPPDRPLEVEGIHSGMLGEVPAMGVHFKPRQGSAPDDLSGRSSSKPVKTVYTSADGQLTAEVTTYQKGVVQIELRTFDKDLGAGTAVIEFIGASGKVLRTASCKFHRETGFVASLEVAAAFDEPASLRFAIRPAKKEERERE